MSPSNIRPRTTRRSSTTTACSPRSEPSETASTTRSPNRFVDSYKTELIADRVWRTNAQLELATVEYAGWFNHRRLHSSIGNRPPVEHEREYWARLALGLETFPAQAAPTVIDLRDVLTEGCVGAVHLDRVAGAVLELFEQACERVAWVAVGGSAGTGLADG